MARFQFRLKTLYAIREATRDERRAQLAEAYAADRKLKDRRAALEQELNEQQQWFRAGIAPGRVDVDRLLTVNRYELVVCAEINVVTQHEQTLAEEIERRRQTLLAADREVRVLEKLRERQLEQFRQQQALAEMKEIDEVAARAVFREEAS
jgi:flagellar FliJ protein